MARRHQLMLLALAGLWGASFMFIKVGVRDFSPITLVGLRMGLGAATLAPIVIIQVGVRTATRELRRAAGPLVLTGLLNSAIPITLISWAETRLDSGLTAVLQASAPLFAALLALRFSRDERVGGSRLAGLVLGFGGVTLLVGVQPSGNLLAGLAVVVSGLCYAVAALYTARAFPEVPPLVIAFGTLTVATLATLPIGLFSLPGHVPGWKVTASVLTLGVAGTGLAYILYYGLLTGAGASRSILITYLVPALALLYGAILLGERISLSAIGGLALVLAGVALGTGAVRLRRRQRAVACSADSLNP